FRQWKARGGCKALRARQRMPRAASHGQTMAHSLQRVANRRRRPFGAECGTEPHVAGKELVAAVARQHHRDLLPRKLRDDIRGNGRRVAKWTVVIPDELLDEIERSRLDDELRVIGLETAGDKLCVRRLVVSRTVLET